MSELKSILRGAAPLSAAEFLGLAAALVTLPYLMRVLGPVEFGRFAFGSAGAGLLGVLVDYGFNQVGTKQVACASEKGPFRASIFWSVQIAKLLLAVCFIPLLGGLAWLLGLYRDYGGILPAALAGAASAWMFPQWFLQGTQRYRTLAASLAAARVLSAIATVWLVDSREDAVIAVLLVASTGCVAGLLAVAIGNMHRELSPVWPGWMDCARQIRLGLPLFISTVAISLYTVCIPLLVGALTSPGTLGIYSAADKLKGALQALLAPIGVAAFPKFSVLFAKDRNQGMSATGRILKLQLALAVGAVLTLLLVGEYLVRTIIGPQFLSAVPTAQILGLCMIFTAISNSLGVQLMLSLNMERAFSTILSICASLGVLWVWVLCAQWQETGAAVAVVATEALVALMMAAYLKHRKII